MSNVCEKYDVVIGNVPFSDIKVHDKDYRDLSVNQGLKQVKIKKWDVFSNFYLQNPSKTYSNIARPSSISL